MKRLAQTDALTGLYNRRRFLEIADKELARAIRYGTELSVLMLDVDHFKKINDPPGHQTGDLALKRLGGLCHAALRSMDPVGRSGGEESAVLLPQTDGAQARVVAERLRGLIDRTPLPLAMGLPLKLTESIGVASLKGHSTNLDTLINQADTALYLAKNRGRSRVSGFQPTSPNVSSGSAMIVPRSLFRCGFAIESIAQAIDD